MLQQTVSHIYNFMVLLPSQCLFDPLLRFPTSSLHLFHGFLSSSYLIWYHIKALEEEVLVCCISNYEL